MKTADPEIFFDFLCKGLGLASSQHFVDDFSRNIFFQLHSINWPNFTGWLLVAFTSWNIQQYTWHILEIYSNIQYWPERALFLKKRPHKIQPPFLLCNPLSKRSHQNKALHNFCKRGQRSIVERNIKVWNNYFSMIGHAVQLS